MAAGADDYLVKPLNPDELSLRLEVAARITKLYQQLGAQQSELERLNQKLFEQARIDPLTGLGSRLRLVEDLEQISGRIQRYSEKYCAIMCDVDHFKSYNDTHGHIAGDEALRAIAAALANGCRKGDQAYRFGGEEFALILPQQSLESACVTAERHRAAVEALKIPHAAGQSNIVTISAGVAALAFTAGVPVVTSLERADAALYRAKRLGRNRVTRELATLS
jgi:two-component system chemotaxis family response regulator WspR